MARLGPGDTLRILLIAERENLREQIGAILVQYAGDHRLYWVAQPEVAAKRAEDLLPHLVLVDDDLSTIPAAAVVRQIMATAPAAVALVMVDETGMGIARQAVLAGARGFVVKPLIGDEFWSTIYQLLVQNQLPAQEMAGQQIGADGKVIVFVGPKGGTGRTMITVNTAISLHKQSGRGVVVLDADYSSPALDVVLNLEGDNDISLLLSRISRLDQELVSSVLAQHSSGIRVLLAPPPNYGTLDISLPHVEQIVTYLRSMFDWVMVDLGMVMDDAGYAFMDTADFVVMTVLPEMVCLRNTRMMLDQLQSRGYPTEKIWLVLNRSTINGGVSRRDIEERLHVRIHHTVPDDQPLVSMAVNRGVPLVISNPRSAVAKALQDLAAMFVKEASTRKQAAVQTPSAQTQAPQPPLAADQPGEKAGAKEQKKGAHPGLFGRVFRRPTSVNA